MKKIISLFVMIWSVCVFAQHGINTTNPITTLEIKAASDGSTKAEGLLIPTLTDAQIQVMPVTSAHAGMLIYNSSKDCVQVYSAKQWKCLSNDNSQGIAQYLNATYTGSNGTWIQNISTNGNTVQFKISNNSNLSFASLDFNNAVTLAGASGGLTVTPQGNYSNVTLASGSSVTLTYTVSGTPTSSGTLTANFSANGLSAYGNITIAPQSQVQATNISFTGNYISNTDFNGNTVKLSVANFTSTSLTGVDMSNAVTLTGISGVSIVPSQNANVSIPAGTTTVLTYNLTGAAAQPGTLTATFTPNAQVSGNAQASQTVSLFGNVSASNMVINGTYAYGQNMNAGNNVTLTVTNNNAFALQSIDLSNAVTLSGANATIRIVAGQNNNVTIPANTSITLTYNISGSSNVVAGGTLTATFKQNPFPTLTATKDVTGNVGFYAAPDVAILPSSGGTYTFNITSASPWTYTLESSAAMNNWVTVTSTTGTNGNGAISIKTNPKTSSEAPETGYITLKQAGGASIQVAVKQSPTDTFAVTSNPQLSIHSSNIATITTNQSQLQVYSGSMPNFVQNVTFSGGSIILTPKERTEVGPARSGQIQFVYGQGYLSPMISITQKQKAAKCPAVAPMRADKGYKIWNSTEKFEPGIFRALVATVPGTSEFSDYTIYGNLQEFDKYSNGYLQIQFTKTVGANESSLIAAIVDRSSYNYDMVDYSFSSTTAGKDFGYEQGPNYRTKYLTMINDNKNIQSISLFSEDGVVFYDNASYQGKDAPVLGATTKVITPLVCADGLDEDTPSVTGNAGWRQ